MVVSLYSCHWISSSLISGLTAAVGAGCWAAVVTGGVAVRAAVRAPRGARGRLVRWTRGLSLTGRRRAMGLGRPAAVGAGEAIVGGEGGTWIAVLFYWGGGAGGVEASGGEAGGAVWCGDGS